MALGNLDINTLERIDDFSPDKALPRVSDYNLVLISVKGALVIKMKCHI